MEGSGLGSAELSDIHRGVGTWLKQSLSMY